MSVPPVYREGEDWWASVRPGDQMPRGAVRAMHRGLRSAHPELVDSAVALWLRDNGEAVFGRAWCRSDGRADAAFPFGGRSVAAAETTGYRVLVYIGAPNDNGFKYVWTRAKKADADKIMVVGEYSPVVVHYEAEQVAGDGDAAKEKPPQQEVLGKGSWNRRLAWTDLDGRELLHDGAAFDNCHFLCKEHLGRDADKD